MLGVNKIFFKLLDKRKIIYCHWKSNEKLDRFLNGESDLDILFYLSDKIKVKKVLEEIGAKKFQALPVGKYFDIYDYIHVDKKTGKLIHYHLYFKLELGESNVKQYLVPWQKEILLNRIRHENSGIWIPSHEHEMFLLILREGLRIPDLKVLIIKYSFCKYNFPNTTIGEYKWLKKKVIKKKFITIINQLLGKDENIINEFKNVYDNGLTFENIIRVKRSLKKFKEKYRTKSIFFSHYTFIKDILKSRFLLFNFFGNPKRRINPRKGLLVAIIGSDGSGKSTLVKNLKTDFGRKIDVKNFYLGLPKLDRFNFLPWKKIINFVGFGAVLNLLIKKRNLNEAIELKKKGMLIICDRFPQSKYNDFMDGPLTSVYAKSNNLLKRWFVTKEKREFKKMHNLKIDVLIKLKINQKTSVLRGQLSSELANMKIHATDNLKFPNCVKVYELDAVKFSAKEINRKVMNIIWKNTY